MIALPVGVVGLHARFVASICKVEGYLKKVDDLFVGIDCDLYAI